MAELCTMVVLSTGTLAREVSAMLDEMGEDVDHHRDFGDWRTGLVRCGYGYGHLVRVPHHDPEDGTTWHERVSAYPDSLRAGFDHARTFGAKWINYDRDGELHGLPEHDW